MYKNSLCTLQKTHSVSITKAKELMLFTKIMTVCSETHTKNT